ncbi:Imm10 family immunity protein [Nonomuraea sp. SBT364]|uniref:Imm10 family immunity protein n=1 Tax=Nonomuraea sp. SBT364 TaxID=1580530 RepID=UPI0007C7C140|nr:Imm10 family immunity protein [Nonomuraea sp. SBT364]
MTVRFTARVAGVAEDHELECLSAGVAERDDGEGMELIFQCGLSEPGEDDAESEMDSYCVVTAGQAASYGAVTEITLHGGVLRVVLAAHALEDLGLDDPEVEAFLDVGDEAVDRLRSALRRIMAYGRADARPVVVRL